MQTRVMPKGLSVRTHVFVTAQTTHAGFETVTIVTGRIAAFVHECGSPVFCAEARVMFFYKLFLFTPYREREQKHNP